MPIVEIELLEDEGRMHPLPAELVRRTTDALGEVFDSPPGGTWVKIKALPRQAYAENGVEIDPAVRPVFVRVLKSRWPTRDVIKREAAQIASVLAELLDRPVENVHVLFEPEAAGRIAFGGVL